MAHEHSQEEPHERRDHPHEPEEPLRIEITHIIRDERKPPVDDYIVKTLDKVLSVVNQIQKTLNKFIMDNQKDFDDVLAAIDEATTTSSGEATRIVTVIETLKQDVINAGLPKASEDAILAKLASIKTGGEALATFLKAVGNDPENPVPEPVPTPEPGPTPEEPPV